MFPGGQGQNGELTFETGNARRRAIEDLPLVDVVSGDRLLVRDLAD